MVVLIIEHKRERYELVKYIRDIRSAVAAIFRVTQSGHPGLDKGLSFFCGEGYV